MHTEFSNIFNKRIILEVFFQKCHRLNFQGFLIINRITSRWFSILFRLSTTGLLKERFLFSHVFFAPDQLYYSTLLLYMFVLTAVSVWNFLQDNQFLFETLNSSFKNPPPCLWRFPCLYIYPSNFAGMGKVLF